MARITADLEAWYAAHRDRIADTNYQTATEGALQVLEVTVTMADGKKQLKRVRLESAQTPSGLPGLLA